MTLSRLLRLRLYWFVVAAIANIDYFAIRAIVTSGGAHEPSQTGNRDEFVRQRLEKVNQQRVDWKKLKEQTTEEKQREQMILLLRERMKKPLDELGPNSLDIFPPGHPLGPRLRDEEKFGPNRRSPSLERRI